MAVQRIPRMAGKSLVEERSDAPRRERFSEVLPRVVGGRGVWKKSVYLARRAGRRIAPELPGFRTRRNWRRYGVGEGTQKRLTSAGPGLDRISRGYGCICNLMPAQRARARLHAARGREGRRDELQAGYMRQRALDVTLNNRTRCSRANRSITGRDARLYFSVRGDYATRTPLLLDITARA